MTLFSLRKRPSFLYELVISNSAESISSSVRVPLSLQSFDVVCSPKIVKLFPDVNFGSTFRLRDFNPLIRDIH